MNPKGDRIVRKPSIVALAVAVLFSTLGAAVDEAHSREGWSPVVVVSFSGYDEIIADVDFIGKLAGNEQLGAMAQGAIQMGLGGQELAGLDKSRPWGLLVETDGANFAGYGFVPVSNLDQLLGVLKPRFGDATDSGDGVMKLEPQNGPPMFVKQIEGGWAVIADQADTFSALPADPLPALAGLEKNYDVAIRVHVNNVPPAVRQGAMMPLQFGLSQGMPKLPGESDEEHQVRMQVARGAMDRLVTMINELDIFQLGLAIDRETSTAFLEYVLTGVEGTETAQQLAVSEDAKTNFAGFVIPDAALSMSSSDTLSEAEIAQAKSQIAMLRTRAVEELGKQGLPDAALPQAKQIIGDLMDILDATVAAGRMDVGMSLLLAPDTVAVLAGMQVADGAKLEGLLKQVFAQAVKDEPELQDAVTLDADEHEGVRFHVLKVPVPGDETEARQMFGDALDVIVGVGKEAVYLAGGTSASEKLKQAIDKSQAERGKTILPMEMVATTTPIAKFIAGLADPPANQMAQAVVDVLEQTEGKDHINVTLRSVPRGLKVRVELEEGLLRLLGSIPALAMAMGGPG
jgi:hypothetical protein